MNPFGLSLTLPDDNPIPTLAGPGPTASQASVLFSGLLQAASLPSPPGLALTVAGTPQAILGAAAAGNELVIGLGSAIPGGVAVVITLSSGQSWLLASTGQVIAPFVISYTSPPEA